jgi:hypothetical protein
MRGAESGRIDATGSCSDPVPQHRDGNIVFLRGSPGEGFNRIEEVVDDGLQSGW